MVLFAISNCCLRWSSCGDLNPVIALPPAFVLGGGVTCVGSSRFGVVASVVAGVDSVGAVGAIGISSRVSSGVSSNVSCVIPKPSSGRYED